MEQSELSTGKVQFMAPVEVVTSKTTNQGRLNTLKPANEMSKADSKLHQKNENEEAFFITDTKFSDALIVWYDDNGWLKGSVYPVSITDPEELQDGKGFYYNSATSSDMTESREQARIYFDFLFVWRGVWEGRIYFKDDEYWSEELKEMTELWAMVEQHLKGIIRGKNPDNEYMLKDE